MSSEEFATVALSRVPAIGPKLFRTLTAHFGSAQEVFGAGVRQLTEVAGIARRTALNFGGDGHFREAEKILDFNRRNDILTLYPGGGRYPVALEKFSSAPPVLYYRGQADLSENRMLAIVGTRTMTTQGREQVERLIDGLMAYGVTIVSGLAYGIDTAAHKQAMRSGLPTVAVMGSGFQHIYPHVNRTTAQRMSERGGGLLTEYPPWQTPEREHFPARNRIVAMLTIMTVVVESGTRGGSIITANMAHDYGRLVGACPGRGGDIAAAGCNLLIKTGRAHLIDGADDIIALLGWQSNRARGAQTKLFESLLPEELIVVETLRTMGDLSIDQLRRELGLPPAKLAGTLLTMEMKGVIASLPGHRYRLATAGI